MHAFLGPIDPDELAKLPSFTEDGDVTAGNGWYSAAWRLPLSHEARARAGVRLALLGDPRPGMDIDPDGTPEIDWCPVPGGEVVIQDSEDKLHQKPTDSFHIARYPITNSQFERRFMRHL